MLSSMLLNKNGDGQDLLLPKKMSQDEKWEKGEQVNRGKMGRHNYIYWWNKLNDCGYG